MQTYAFSDGTAMVTSAAGGLVPPWLTPSLDAAIISAGRPELATRTGQRA